MSSRSGIEEGPCTPPPTNNSHSTKKSLTLKTRDPQPGRSSGNSFPPLAQPIPDIWLSLFRANFPFLSRQHRKSFCRLLTTATKNGQGSARQVRSGRWPEPRSRTSCDLTSWRISAPLRSPCRRWTLTCRIDIFLLYRKPLPELLSLVSPGPRAT